MTRINSAIPVQRLTDEHLLAEHREIKRLPYCLQEAIRTGSIKRIPQHFVLGKGHVTFFLNKMLFCRNRYLSIYAECRRRHFDVENYSANFSTNVPDIYLHNYIPGVEEHKMLVDRITERIKNSSKQTWHYCGRPLSKEEAMQLIVNC